MLPGSNSKEEPNTKNVVIWPEKIRNQIRLVEEYDKLENLKFRQKNIEKTQQDEINNLKLKHNAINHERIEYYIFLIFGSLIWLLIAHTILKWHQFPFHKHVYESLLIYFCPLILIIIVLYLLDFGISREDVKKHN